MKHGVAAALILAGLALPATAYARDAAEAGTTGATQSAGRLDPCMLTASVEASYTAARNEDIYGIARKQCGYATSRAAPHVDEVQAAAAWTSLVTGLRDRRRGQDALYGLVQVARR